jgi:K+-sensing histidine kinase KdpD
MKETNPQTAHILASVAHDLRSPLNAVIGFSRILLKGIDGPLSELQTADLEAIHENGVTMLRMVDSIVDLAKIEAGWLTPLVIRFHVPPLLEKARSLVGAPEQQERIQIAYLPGGAPPPVYADEAQILRALERTLATAVHLSGAGTVRLACIPRRDDLLVTISCTSPQGLAADTPQFLDGFRSSGGSQEDRVTWVGLYMLASQRSIALNGGALWIEDPSETELTIGLTLPLSPRR